MNKPMRIERGNVSEAGSFARLHAACFADAWPEDAFAALLSRDGVIALAARRAEGRAPDGFILVQVAADEAEVLTLCVSPEARGRGVGETLLGAACETARARSAAQMFLEVGEANTPALKLYQRAGFEAVGRRSAYYQRGAKNDDALVMRKALNQS